MEPRIKGVIEDLTQLRPILDDVLCLDMKLDDTEDLMGVSIKVTDGGDKPEEIIWLELIENSELDVHVHPDVDDLIESKVLWTVLYCISANLKEEEPEVWGDLKATEIAEEIYENRQEKGKYTEELEKNVREYLEESLGEAEAEGLVEIPEEELPDEITLELVLEDVLEMIMNHNDEDALVLVDFFNKIVKLSGLDLQVGVSKVNLETGEESEPQFKLDEGKSEIGRVKPKGGREEHGLLEQDYVIQNLAIIIEQLLSEKGDKKGEITFLNELVFERIQIEKLLEVIFPEEE